MTVQEFCTGCTRVFDYFLIFHIIIMPKRRLKWIIPGIKRPNFVFPRVKFNIYKIQINSKLIQFLCYALIFFIFSGGVYNNVKHPHSYGGDNEGIHLIYDYEKTYDYELGKLVPSCSGNIQYQFLFEGIAAGICIFMGFAGLFLIYSASKNTFNPDKAANMQLGGSVLIFFSLLIIASMLTVKGCSLI